MHEQNIFFGIIKLIIFIQKKKLTKIVKLIDFEYHIFCFNFHHKKYLSNMWYFKSKYCELWCFIKKKPLKGSESNYIPKSININVQINFQIFILYT